MKENGLQGKVLSGFAWKFGERIGAQLVSFFVRIILARILLLEDYGLVAMIMIFIEIGNVFVISGFGQSLIQKKDADNLDFSSVFYFSVAMSWILYAVIFAASPAIASFYGNPALSPILRVLALKLPLAGVNSVQQAYVQKYMMFKRFFFSTLIGTVVSAVVGIAMAYQGFGPWALVAQYLCNSAMDTLILWVTVKWRPILKFSGTRMRELFSFGWKMLMSHLIDTTYKQFRTLVIGKIYREQELANYDQGQKFPSIIVTNVNSSIGSVLFPAMATKQGNKAELKQMVRRSIQVGSYIIWPLMIGFAVVAEPVVRIILSDKWLPCVPFLQIACIQFALEPVQTTFIQAVKALGRGRTMLVMEIIKKGVGLLTVLAVMRQGVMWIAWSGIAIALFSTFVDSTPSRRYLAYSWREQFADQVPAIMLALTMGVCVYGAGFLPLPLLPLLLVQILAGVSVYILLSVIFRVRAFSYLWGILKKALGRER